MRAKARFSIQKQENVIYLEPRARQELAARTIAELENLGYSAGSEVAGVVILIPPLGANMTCKELLIDYRSANRG